LLYIFGVFTQSDVSFATLAETWQAKRPLATLATNKILNRLKKSGLLCPLFFLPLSEMEYYIKILI